MGNTVTKMLGRNLKALRESRGLTIPTVSIATGFTYIQLSNWEDARGGIPLSMLAKLCDYYRYYDIYKMITVEIRFTFNPIYAGKKNLTSCG